MNFTQIRLFFCVILVTLCGAYNNGAGRLPPMGWSTWCTDNAVIPCLGDYCSEKEVMDVAKHMATNGMKELGYEYINLDDCWAAERTSDGTITAEKSRFPSGTLKPLADYVHSLGLKFGLYTDVGPRTCKQNRPGSWPYYEKDANTYASWEIDFVKQDWCDHPGGYTAEELYSNMSHALNQTGRPMVFNMCGWGLYTPWVWGGKIANSWRVGPDHIPLWWTPETKQDPGQGQGTANIIQHMAGKSKYATFYQWNDPDFLMPGYFWESSADFRTAFSFWCLFCAPLIVATDIRELSDKQEILNKEAIAINQDALGIAGDIRVNNSDGGQIWSKQLSDNTWAVILYNSNIWFDSVDITFEFNSKIMIGWPSGVTEASIRDLWSHQDLGKFSKNLQVKGLEIHDSKLYKVAPIKN